MYTNFAQQYMTGPGANYGFNAHSWTLAQAANPWLTKSQFKVATQQLLQNRPDLFQGKGYANEKLKAQVLRNTPGMGAPGSPNPANPLGWAQGPGGQLGKKAYDAVQATGKYKTWEIPSLAARGGMTLPSGAYSAWQKDMNKDQEEAMAKQLDARMAEWDTKLADIQEPPKIRYNEPTVITGSGGRFQQQGESTASRRRGRGVREAFGRKGRIFNMNLPGSGSIASERPSTGTLNIA